MPTRGPLLLPYVAPQYTTAQQLPSQMQTDPGVRSRQANINETQRSDVRRKLGLTMLNFGRSSFTSTLRSLFPSEPTLN